MDRERKLLYTVAVLAAIVEIMAIVAYYYQPGVSEFQAAVQEARSCEKQLIRVWAECIPRHSHHGRI